MVAVCSLENDAVLNELGVRTTTDPIQLALWAGTGPVAVFATYASLVDREDVEDPMGPGQGARAAGGRSGGGGGPGAGRHAGRRRGGAAALLFSPGRRHDRGVPAHP